MDFVLSVVEILDSVNYLFIGNIGVFVNFVKIVGVSAIDSSPHQDLSSWCKFQKCFVSGYLGPHFIKTTVMDNCLQYIFTTNILYIVGTASPIKLATRNTPFNKQKKLGWILIQIP